MSSDRWPVASVGSMIHAQSSTQLCTTIYLRFNKHFMFMLIMQHLNGQPAGIALSEEIFRYHYEPCILRLQR